MREINVMTTEIESRRMLPEHRDAAVEALRQDGFVVLSDVVDPAHIATLRERMMQDTQHILEREDAPFNFNTGNLQQDPPPFAPYLFRDVLMNEMVIAVTRELLGPGLHNSFYSGNTALPGGSRQPVHPDVAQLWPGLEHPTPPFGIVVNVPVVDMTPENGSTEVWPGTHHDTSYSVHDSSLRIPEEVLDRRRALRAPIQPSVRSGSVVLRDIRLWHAGMPNRTALPRPMIAMIHWCSWWTSAEPIPFSKSDERFFEHPILKTNVRFVDGEPDYIGHNQAYDFQK